MSSAFKYVLAAVDSRGEVVSTRTSLKRAYEEAKANPPATPKDDTKQKTDTGGSRGGGLPVDDEDISELADILNDADAGDVIDYFGDAFEGFTDLLKGKKGSGNTSSDGGDPSDEDLAAAYDRIVGTRKTSQ